jgi:hypothetical protein
VRKEDKGKQNIKEKLEGEGVMERGKCTPLICDFIWYIKCWRKEILQNNQKFFVTHKP